MRSSQREIASSSMTCTCAQTAILALWAILLQRGIYSASRPVHGSPLTLPREFRVHPFLDATRMIRNRYSLRHEVLRHDRPDLPHVDLPHR